jgi:uncharacterized protein (UPF0332 family)
MSKANHNLKFVKDINTAKYIDWGIVGCYYSCYHAALSLIMTKGFSSKNHLATLLILIKEFYNKELNKDDLETFSNALDHEDILFYVESKNKRENASYSSNMIFNKKDFENLRIKSILFVSKIREIIMKR